MAYDIKVIMTIACLSDDISHIFHLEGFNCFFTNIEKNIGVGVTFFQTNL